MAIMKEKQFLSQLPEPCRELVIQPRHRVALQHFTVDGHIWVVLLTRMPGDSCKAWMMPKWEYWKLRPKYGSRDRYIRENFPPHILGEVNPQIPQLASLF